MTVTGRCRCEAVSYEIAVDALPRAYACYCHQCQRWSGSAFSLQILVPEAVLSVVGPIVEYRRTTEDRTSHQRMCGVCHARIYNTNTRRPGVAVIRAGTLDRSEELDCVAHIFTESRQHWITIPDGVPCFSGPATPAAMAALSRG